MDQQQYHGQILGTYNGLPVHIKTDENGNLYVVSASNNAKEPFSGSTSKVHTFTQPMNGFVISNDGDSDLTITINDGVFTVKAGEVFDEMFDSFTQVTITTTSAYRAYGRG